MTGEERADLAYLGKLVTDARGEGDLDGPQRAMATASAWVAIMAASRQDDHDGGGGESS